MLLQKCDPQMSIMKTLKSPLNMKAPDLRGKAGRTCPQGSAAVGTEASARLQGSLKSLLQVCAVRARGFGF